MQGHWAKPLQWCFRIFKPQHEGYFLHLCNSVGLTEGRYYSSDGDPEWKSQSLFQEEGLSTGNWLHSSVQFRSVTQLCLTLCDPVDCRTPGLPVHHELPEFTQTEVHWVCDAIQPSHPLSSSSPPTFNFSQHRSIFKWVSSSHQVAEVVEFQLQHQSFQRIFRIDFL